MALNHSPSIVRNGLVLYLDAANSKSYPGSGTTWTDLSGNSNNGTLTNGPTYSSANNGSIVFDGVDDYVSVYSATNAFFCNLNGNTTISYYIKCSAFTSVAGGGSVFQDRYITSTCWNGTFDTLFYNTAKKKLVTALQTNTVYNIVIDTTNFLMYVNGNLASTTDQTISWATDNLSPKIGKNYYNSFSGNIYNFMVYNRVLSATEIKQNFNALRGRYGI